MFIVVIFLVLQLYLRSGFQFCLEFFMATTAESRAGGGDSEAERRGGDSDGFFSKFTFFKKKPKGEHSLLINHSLHYPQRSGWIENV